MTPENCTIVNQRVSGTICQLFYRKHTLMKRKLHTPAAFKWICRVDARQSQMPIRAQPTPRGNPVADTDSLVVYP